MHLTIMALGSRGDVLPCVTLGKALKANGHQVRIATFHNFSGLIMESGLDFHLVQGDIQALLNRPEGVSFIESGQNTLQLARTIQSLFGELAESFPHDLYSPTLWETDLIINQLPGGLYGYDLAEKLGIPMVLAAVMPLTPTRHNPQLAFPSVFSAIPRYNTFTHWFAYQLVWHIFRKAVNRRRVSALGLSKAPFWGYASPMQREGVPVVNGFSVHVVPRPADWGKHIHITGYWFPPESAWQPPDELRKFIEAGPPPVFIGFGSMPLRDPKRITRIVLDTLKRIDQRAILHTGWGNLGQQDTPANVHLIEYAPYEWLFPRMSALVHHGGSGTTGFGLRAGVPSVIVPFVFDQFYWGKRLSDLGLGPQSLPLRKLTVDRLSETLDMALTDEKIRMRAADMSEKIREEEGVKAAVEVIEDHAAG